MAPETPKGVSSRLLTMKFMQRAAASASSSPNADIDRHSAKKRKLDSDVAHDNFEANFNQASIKAAIDERAVKRQAALNKHASAADTHWTINPRLDRNEKGGASRKSRRDVVYTGYEDDSRSDGEWEDDPRSGRMATHSDPIAQLEMAKRKRSEPEESDSHTTNDELPQTDGTDATVNEPGHDPIPSSRGRPRPDRRGGQAAESLLAKEFRDKRKTKQVRLNKLTSISSSGNNFAPNTKNIECHTCHQTGHRSADCPERLRTKPSTRGR